MMHKAPKQMCASNTDAPSAIDDTLANTTSLNMMMDVAALVSRDAPY